MKILPTRRLLLRPLAPADAAFVAELVNEPAWLRFIGDRRVRTLADARGYLARGPLAHYARAGFGHLAVERAGDHELLGICGLIKRETLDDVDLGFAFLERHRGQGYAEEAARAVLADGWSRLGLTRVVALTLPDNTSSIRLLAKLGFRFERLLRLTADTPESRLFALERAPLAAETLELRPKQGSLAP